MADRRVVQRALVAAVVLLVLVGCGSSAQDDSVAVVADGPAGGALAPRETAAIVDDELQLLTDDAVSSTIKLPAALAPTMSGFGPIVAAMTADGDLLAYLGWDPAPAFERAERGEAVEPGTPLGTQILHIVKLGTGEHSEIRGVLSFALRPNGDIAYVRTPDPQVLSQTPQPTHLVHRSATGDETVVADDGHFRAARWSGDALLYTDAASSEPGPFMLKSYSAATGRSVDVGEGLSVFATLDDGSVVVVPNHDSFLRNFQRYDVGTGELVDLALAEHVSDDIRIIGLGLVEDGGIAFHGQQEPSATEVVGRISVVDDVVSVLDLVSLDVRSIQGIEQISTTREGAVTGWGLNPRAMPKGPREVDGSAPRLVEFTCAGECAYRDVDTLPAVRVTILPEDR